jgi:alpha-L-fucosidase 2
MAELRQTQRCLLAGDYEEGKRRSEKYLQSMENNFGTNLVVGRLDITVNGTMDSEGVRGFERELRLDSAVAEVRYDSDGHRVRRRSFMSYPHQVLIVSFESDNPEGLNLEVSIQGQNEAFAARSRDGRIEFDAQALETVHSDGTCGVTGHGVVGVYSDSREVESKEGKIFVRGKKSATILLAFTTNYQQTGDGWREQASRQIEEATKLSVADLLAAHLADYQPLYRRMSITLGPSSGSEPASLPTDQRRQKFEPSNYADPGMFTLYFHYARYLTIAGTRATSPLPLNLQGLWNDGEACRMGWSCDYHIDMNTQMNYFPMLPSALPDLMQPLISYLKRLVTAGKDAAQACYGCDGWVAHVFSNVWGFADPGWETSYGLNVTGGLWMASHLIEMYEYTLDETLLGETAYPILKGAAEFFLHYMIEDPETGWLLTGPAVSPENSFFIVGKDGNKEEHSVCLSPTIDVELLRDLFAFCVHAAKRLNTDSAFAQRVQAAQAKLPPLQVGKHGQLQEWLYDFEEAQPYHRHLSHTMALCRSAQVSLRHTPLLAEAIGVTLERRQGRDDLEDIEFTAALFGLNYARLGKAEKAEAQIGHLVGELSFDNLLSYSKPGVAGAEKNIFVVDGNFGGAAVIAEMLVRSLMPDLGGPVEVDLLPALPKLWSEGAVKGMRLRGNLELDMEWFDGRLEKASFKAFSPGSMTVYYHEQSLKISYKADDAIELGPGLQVRK